MASKWPYLVHKIAWCLVKLIAWQCSLVSVAHLPLSRGLNGPWSATAVCVDHHLLHFAGTPSSTSKPPAHDSKLYVLALKTWNPKEPNSYWKTNREIGSTNHDGSWDDATPNVDGQQPPDVPSNCSPRYVGMWGSFELGPVISCKAYPYRVPQLWRWCDPQIALSYRAVPRRRDKAMKWLWLHQWSWVDVAVHGSVRINCYLYLFILIGHRVNCILPQLSHFSCTLVVAIETEWFSHRIWRFFLHHFGESFFGPK